MKTHSFEPVPTDLGSGTEIEVQLQAPPLQGSDDRKNISPPPFELRKLLEAYVQEQEEKLGIISTRGQHKFDTTGGLTYLEGNELAEFATAECRSIGDLVIRNRAMQSKAAHLGLIWSRQIGRKVFINLRTAGNKDSSACHDNVGAHLPEMTQHSRNRRPALVSHLATRSVHTGAGLITQWGMYFGQKMHYLDHETGAAVKSGYSLKKDKGQETIVEIRCSDFNISDEAIRLRVGMGKIAVLLEQSPLAHQFEEFAKKYVPDLISGARRFNNIPVDAEGNLRKDSNAVIALDQQIRLAEVFLAGARYFEDTPYLRELQEIAERGIKLSDDTKLVLAGEKELEYITTRCDWAAKLHLARLAMQEDRESGRERSLFDARGQFRDLHYDLIVADWREDKTTGQLKPVVTLGGGYKYRDHHTSGLSTAEIDVIARTPPSDSRAALRAKLIRDYKVAKCAWGEVELYPAPGQPEVLIAIDLPSATTTVLTPEQQADLEGAIRR